ncbi:MerR family transcriptional regulator [Brevibacillus laterosporus]|nr:MerR family transcriptional regulator [Brevibacillus laterosporus]TPG69833.1 MerR family transcriptional regulator [Brevibacillus laterosporus]
MKNRFTIGKMARMHRIAESTLRYYDEKGIFQPKTIDQKTQYRYYTIDQFSTLTSIKFFRHLGIPLLEIKRFMDERTPDLALDILEKQSESLKQKQQEIAYMLNRLESKITTIKQGVDKVDTTVVFKDLPKRYIHSMVVEADLTDEDWEYHLHVLQSDLQLLEVSLFAGDIGTSVSKSSILKGEYQDYNSLFIMIDDLPVEKERYPSIPAGLYACTMHYGSYEQLGQSYERLLLAIRERHYEITGKSYELGIVDLAITSESDEFVTEIQIPVQSSEYSPNN